jgi:hypothetical protein
MVARTDYRLVCHGWALEFWLSKAVAGSRPAAGSWKPVSDRSAALLRVAPLDMAHRSRPIWLGRRARQGASARASRAHAFSSFRRQPDACRTDPGFHTQVESCTGMPAASTAGCALLHSFVHHSRGQ